MTTLNYADKFYIGGAQPSAVYLGATKVWRPFVPTSISGCVIWLDASKLSLANGAAVSSWTNLGSGPQPTLFGSGAPVFRTNAVNTIMPVVRQTGTQGKFRFAGTGVDKEYTIAFVARKWSSTIGRLFSTPPASNVLFGWWSNRIDLMHNNGWLAPDIVTPGTTAWKLYSADQTATGSAARFFSNGTLLRSSATASNGLAGALWFGGYDDTTEFGDGDYAEILLYNRKLTDAERQAVEKYLREKWMGLPQWSPSDLGVNLTAWFDSSDVSTVQLAGQGVNNWVNKKGGGAMTLTQSVNDTYRPTINNGDGVTFALAQGMNAAGGPASFDVFVVGKPNPPAAAPVDWRTLLRSATGHEIIVEAGSSRLGTYSGGFLSATVGRVSPINMTAENAPPPYVTSGDGSNSFQAFDGVATTYSHSNVPISTRPYWTKIDLGSSQPVGWYRYQARHDGQTAVPYQQWRSWRLEGSDNDSTWTLVDTVTNVPDFALSEARIYGCDVLASFRYWRWTVTAATGYADPYAAAGGLELHNGLSWDAVEGLCFARVAPSNAVLMSRNGGPLISTVTALGAGSAAPTMFGCYMGPPPTQGFGAVREIIFVPYNLESERQKIEGYLAHKWGLDTLLPAGHPYKAAPP